MGRDTPGSETIKHSSGIILLLRNVTILPATGNFSIPCAVDGIARIFLTPCLPIIPLYGDGDLTTMKFIQAKVECSSSPIFTSNDICPSGHIISPMNPTSGIAAGTIRFLTSGRNLLKQSSMIMGPSVPSSSPSDGKEITDSGEKV
ncbi:hypothetical protein Tco_1580156 [Tanacetum coccineum]